MKLLSLLALLMATFTVNLAHSNDCTLRTWFDPSTTKQTIHKVTKALKHKNYKILKFEAPVVEDYRLVVSNYDTFVRFYFQEFDAPNFKDVFRVDQPTNNELREQTTLDLLNNIQTCKTQ